MFLLSSNIVPVSLFCTEEKNTENILFLKNIFLIPFRKSQMFTSTLLCIAWIFMSGLHRDIKMVPYKAIVFH